MTTKLDESEELYQKVRHLDGVVSVGVKKGSADLIVYINKSTKAVLSKIPKECNGKSVKVESIR